MYNYDYLDMLGDYGSVNSGYSTWSIIALVIAIIGGICLYFTVFSEANEKKYNGFMAKLYEFIKFKKLYISTFLKVTYLILAIFVTLYSFELISVSFVSFIVLLILGNILLRFAYEFALVLLGIYENTTEIAKNTKKKNESK